MVDTPFYTTGQIYKIKYQTKGILHTFAKFPENLGLCPTAL